MSRENNGRELDLVSKQGSINSILKRGSIHSLASTATGLDDLIKGASALEMASGDDTEMLKRYSERIAMEAEDSEKE